MVRSEPSLLLHLSDLHFGPHNRFAKDDPQDLAKRFSRWISEAVKRKKIDLPVSHVVVTGDIAESGLEPQYKSACTFFEGLASESGIDRSRFVFVPGNHDVSWPDCLRVEAEQMEKGFDDDEFYKRILTKKFNKFRSFLNKFYVEGSDDRKELNLGAVIHTFADAGITIAALNSCERESHRSADHMGVLSVEQGQVVLDHWNTPDFADYVKIVAVHHNPGPTVQENVEEWKAYVVQNGGLSPAEAERYATDLAGFEGNQHLRRIAEDGAVQLVLHGHQHAADEQSIKWRGGTTGLAHVLSAGSATLISEKLPKDHPNSARLILLDPQKKELTGWLLRYDPLARSQGFIAPGAYVSRDEEPHRGDLHFLPTRQTKGARGTAAASAGQPTPTPDSINASVILDHIVSGKTSFSDLRKIGLTALQEYYGNHSKNTDSYFNYIVDHFLDSSHSGDAVWRENVSSHMTLKNIEQGSSLADQNLVVWQETKTFMMKCVAETATFPLFAGSSLVVKREILEQVLGEYDFWIKVGDVELFDIQTFLRLADLGQLKENGEIGDEHITFTYDDRRLSWAYVRELDASSHQPTHVTMFEKTYLNSEDRICIWSSRLPMRGFQAYLELEASLEGWTIDQVTVGPEKYKAGAEVFVNVEYDRAERKWVSVTVPNWVLPGIGIILEWSPQIKG